jgi:hypothetical protein
LGESKFLYHWSSKAIESKRSESMIVIIGILILAGGAGDFIVNQRTLSLAPIPAAALTPTPSDIPSPTPTPTPIPQKPVQQITSPGVSNSFSVVDLLTNKEHYLGTQVRVWGKIVINIFYSAKPCPTDGSVCDTSMGAQLELWEPQPTSGTENKILIFKNGEPYPCEKFASEKYRCGSYSNGELIVIDGIWSKDQVPDQAVGYSSGQPPTVLKWKDRYFLEIK